MKKWAFLVLGLVLIAGKSMAEIAAATFKSANGEKIQVIINKKIINSEPKPVVKVKGSGGLHQVKIRIFTADEEIEVKQELKISGGFHNSFIISLHDHTPEVKKASSSRIYNYQFKRPDKFYNRRFYAFLKTLIKKHPIDEGFIDKHQMILAPDYSSLA